MCPGVPARGPVPATCPLTRSTTAHSPPHSHTRSQWPASALRNFDQCTTSIFRSPDLRHKCTDHPVHRFSPPRVHHTGCSRRPAVRVSSKGRDDAGPQQGPCLVSQVTRSRGSLAVENRPCRPLPHMIASLQPSTSARLRRTPSTFHRLRTLSETTRAYVSAEPIYRAFFFWKRRAEGHVTSHAGGAERRSIN